MRGRLVFLISVGLNLALAIALVCFFATLRPKPQPLPERLTRAAPGQNLVKTNVVVRRQNFTWGDIESKNYPTYIANLRAIGCPEPTIRDIIIAEINQLYAHKRATEVITPEQQWWRSDPDSQVAEAAYAKLEKLEQERRELLSKLLGDDWEQVYPSATTILALDGPVLGNLSLETKTAVQQISARSEKRIQDYLQDQLKTGKINSTSDLARLRQQTRDELARVLTPTQLEEYLLRYSHHAQALRNELRGFNVGPDEFRGLFRIRDSIDQQIELNYSGTDPASVKRRQELEEQKEAALQQLLAPERYQLYKLNQDPLFRQAQATAQQFGAPPEAVLPLYKINQATELERQQIRNDLTLEPEERDEAFEETERAHRQLLRQLLGDEIYEKYLESQNQ